MRVYLGLGYFGVLSKSGGLYNIHDIVILLIIIHIHDHCGQGHLPCLQCRVPRRQGEQLGMADCSSQMGIGSIGNHHKRR